MNHVCKNVAVLIILFLSKPAFASSYLQCRTPQIDTSKMMDAIKNLSAESNQVLPKWDPKSYGEVQYITKEEVPSEAASLLYRMQERVFGKQLLTMETSSDINFAAAFERHSILVNPSLWTTLLESNKIQDARNVLRFILAHELGHYVQAMTALKNKTIFSVNGHIAAGITDYEDKDINNYLLTYLKNLGIKKPKKQQIHSLGMLLASNSHVEVDIYGYLILRLIGGKPALASDLQASFDIMEELINSKLSAADKKLELQMYKKYPDLKMLNACALENRMQALQMYYLSDYLDGKSYLQSLPQNPSSVLGRKSF